MRPGRIILASLGLSVAVIAAVASYRAAHRPIPLEAPPPVPEEDLIGRKLPSFSAPDLDGRVVSPATLAGHVAVINVWATWCKPCVEELPRMEKELWQQYRPTVVVVGIARGEDVIPLHSFRQHAHITYSVVPDPQRAFTRLFGGDGGIPRTYVVSREGRIVYQTLGYVPGDFENLVEAVKKELARN